MALNASSARCLPTSLCASCGTTILSQRLPVLQLRRPFFSSTRRSQAKSPESHYDFFPESIPTGPPPKGPFKVDEKKLRREFLQLQGSAHPDRHPQDMKRRAEALSARVNEAYKTLLDPLRRTQYILSLKGIDVAEDETAKVEDPDLLMQVLETREVIEDAQEESDLKDVRRRNDVNLAESLEVLEGAFAEDDMALAKEEAIKLRYWVNIRDCINDWEKGKSVVMIH